MSLVIGILKKMMFVADGWLVGLVSHCLKLPHLDALSCLYLWGGREEGRPREGVNLEIWVKERLI